MREDDYDEFAALLDGVYDLIGKSAQAKVISGQAKAIFFTALAGYPLPVVRTALSAHCMDRQRGKFTPSPADIVEQIELAAQRDTRPEPEEAWAIALRSQDEAETVVWTQECAEAFVIARPVLDTSGPISARKSFLEAYARLVREAREVRRPVAWVASLGTDPERRTAAVKRAHASGLLPAPVVNTLLLGGPPDGEDDGAEQITLDPKQQLDHIRKLIAEGAAEKIRRLEAAEQERLLAEAHTSALIENQVFDYQRQQEAAADDAFVDQAEQWIVMQAGDVGDGQ